MSCTHEAPAPGTFIRAVGQGHGYCLRVLQVFPEDKDGPETLECERWGRDEHGQPMRDSDHGKSYLTNLLRIAPGIWRDTFDFGGNPRWACCPLYYRAMPHQTPQMELFE